MMATSVIDDCLTNANTMNWIKSVQAMNITREAISSVVETEITTFHCDIRSKFRSLCGSCNSTNAVHCPLGICSDIAKHIASVHRFGRPCYRNSDITKWLSDPLEIAKCYMPNKGLVGKPLSDIDLLSLLTLIINNTRFERLITVDFTNGNTIITKGRRARNNIMHSRSTEMTVYDLNDYCDIFIDIVNTFGVDKAEYVGKIEKLKTEDMTLSKNACMPPGHFVKLAEGKYYDPTEMVGRGRYGNVYKGRSGCTKAMFTVAVKQILRTSNDKGLTGDLNEARILQLLETKRNPNVVGYYELFLTDSHLYIFTELFNFTLVQYVEDSREHLRCSFSATAVNRCLADGLAFLHAEGVVHRDLKPSNIFIGLNGKETKIEKVAIGDFGSAKRCHMQFEHSASQSNTNAPGTVGYVSPEVWKWYRNVDDIVQDENKYFTVKSDTYSLGLIFYFTISNGKHPFGKGDAYTIQKRIQKLKEPNLEEASIEYENLIRKMINTDSIERMSAEDVLNHPALWSSEQILNYFKEKSNFLKDSKSPIVPQLNDKLKSSEIVKSRDWFAELPTALKVRLCENRPLIREKGHSVTTLLRAIRNTEHHLDDYPELSGGPDHRVTVWMKACPGFTMCVYDVFKEFDQRDLRLSEA